MRSGVKVRFGHYVRDVEEHDLVEREWVTTANFDETIAKNASIRECDVIGEISREVQVPRATFSYQKGRELGDSVDDCEEASSYDDSPTSSRD